MPKPKAQTMLQPACNPTRKWKLIYSIMGIYRGNGKRKWKLLYSIVGIYQDKRKGNGNYYLVQCDYRDSGKEIGNYYIV